MEEIIELVEECKLVIEKSVQNGHDCWGNIDWSTEKYVFINGKQERCFNGWYVIHDGKNVKEITTKYLLDSRKSKKQHLEKTGFETPREYDAYLKGKNEKLNNMTKEIKVYPEVGKKYRHYKGGLYEVLTMATHSETNEVLVVYKSLYFGSVYVRPLSMWFDEIQLDNKTVTRFTLE